MKSDGGLRALMQTHLPEIHWQAIETWSTGQGVPDANGCLDGKEFWLENKRTFGWKVDLSAQQIAWLERRARAGGRVFVAVRRMSAAGPRKGGASDALYIFRGTDARTLAREGLQSATLMPLCSSFGGPKSWDWAEVKRILILK